MKTSEQNNLSDEASGKTCSFDVCGECKASCCQDAKPPLTNERKKIIRDYLKNHGISIKQPFAKAGYSHPAVDAAGFCVFYNKATKKCLVHQVKPETCKAGPITFDVNCNTEKLEWFLKTGEICIFAPKLYQNRERFVEHFKVARAEILRLICKLDTEALQTVLKVEEPQTFKLSEEDLPEEVAKKLKVKIKHK